MDIVKTIAIMGQFPSHNVITISFQPSFSDYTEVNILIKNVLKKVSRFSTQRPSVDSG
ncbi:hypothetical protein DPMN_125791 [Dreissena polymorpha]|uniref:Uncharacterized protein n=1 Tax=Dreissena polymorpha TaxID=45954 RepID=A0A9D4GUJ9_DREPO|nr:hypothetical protein DPMN_125791 [Dreissena polymorpha]